MRGPTLIVAIAAALAVLAGCDTAAPPPGDSPAGPAVGNPGEEGEGGGGAKGLPEIELGAELYQGQSLDDAFEGIETQVATKCAARGLAADCVAVVKATDKESDAPQCNSVTYPDGPIVMYTRTDPPLPGTPESAFVVVGGKVTVYGRLCESETTEPSTPESTKPVSPTKPPTGTRPPTTTRPPVTTGSDG
ncbi:hypothetical protein [Nocardia sp. NPDC050406]|uniref:hypothetical protein n=1 Tax=Nocardia sp. NPDC050406 TaxID=3364318 RepID=UPI0037A01889